MNQFGLLTIYTSIIDFKIFQNTSLSFKMPMIRIFTNLSKISFKPEFSRDFVKLLATSLDKPANKISVCVIPDCVMMLGGSDRPEAQISLTSIARFGDDVKKMSKYCTEINSFVSERLSIPLDRIGIEFTDVKPFEVGRGVKLYTEILAEASK